MNKTANTRSNQDLRIKPVPKKKHTVLQAMPRIKNQYGKDDS